MLRIARALVAEALVAEAIDRLRDGVSNSTTADTTAATRPSLNEWTAKHSTQAYGRGGHVYRCCGI